MNRGDLIRAIIDKILQLCREMLGAEPTFSDAMFCLSLALSTAAACLDRSGKGEDIYEVAGHLFSLLQRIDDLSYRRYLEAKAATLIEEIAELCRENLNADRDVSARKLNSDED